ncbi:cytosolic phospholipase A2 gamma-like isoform X2 [Brachyhypopomus gauderio]|uniref:cytosolic phospholipase A2 gamma-like isoform X2 n=1 Tax=Brachyhypopomus gauderio TaxID=698409 RepID=UPI004041377C
MRLSNSVVWNTNRMDSPGRVVRLGHSLNEAERQHVSNRRATVQQCLQKHNIPCSLDEVPNIAVLGSGGGERAMIGLLGSLSQLGEEGLLDCIMYLSGVSGSTWCMSSVYKEPDWSTKMETVKQNIIQRLVSGHVSYTEQYERLKKTYERDNFSVTDIWAALFVSSVVKEIDEHVLTEQRGQHTRDPYPIYTVNDKQCSHDTLYKDVWFEITPDECGYSLTGAFVDSTAWESQFENTAVTKKLPENDMMYLQGLCGSALADWKEIKKWIFEHLLHLLTQENMWINLQAPNKEEGYEVLCTLLELSVCFFRQKDASIYIKKINQLLKGEHDKKGHRIHFEEPVTEESLRKEILRVCDSFFDWFPDLLMEGTDVSVVRKHSSDAGFSEVIVKCLKKLWKWDWGTTYNFIYKMTAAEVHPSILKSETRQYEDAGLLLNSPYFSVLRKERNVDLIISLDFSAGDPFATVDTAVKICKDLQISFPSIVHLETGEEPDDFYVFKDNTAPTVIHIPLFNAVNCKGEVEKWKNRYHTFQSPYSEDMIRDLLEIAALNITNAKQKFLEEIKEIIQRKRREETHLINT